MLGFLISAFNSVLCQPLFNGLVLLYEYLPGRDFGVAVIILTLIIKMILYPSGAKAVESQKALQEIQPKIKEIQEKFKNNQEQQMKAIVETYKKANINPFSSLLPLLIQLPVLIALYQVFWRGFSPEQLTHLYSFVPDPGLINTIFLGIVDVSKPFMLKLDGQTIYYWPVLFLAVLTGAAQFFQTKMIIAAKPKKKAAGDDMSKLMEKQMLYFLPVFTIAILLTLPAVLALYWLTSTLFTIGQQYIILKK